MAEETTNTSGSSTEQADDLSWETLEREVEAETVQTEETVKEDATATSMEPVEEHPTVKGRKAWEFVNDKIGSLETKLDQFISRASKETPAVNSPKADGDLFEALNAVEPCPVDPDIPLNAREQIQLDSWKTRTQGVIAQRSRQQYTDEYLSKMNKLSDEGGELHARVIHMITSDNSPFNRMNTGKGDVDAELNYVRALKSLLKEAKSAEKAVSKTEGTGVTVSTTKDTSHKVAPKLEPEAQAYADYLGMSSEDRADAMTRQLVPGAR